MKYLSLTGSETVSDMAELMSIPSFDAIRVGFERMGRLLTVADHLDRSDATRLAREFGFEVRWRSESE